MCDLTAREGDLDQRFTPSPSALEGMMGHHSVTSNRDSSYQTEISLTGEYQNIFVRGRADGFDPDLMQLEEIKTYKGHLDRIPENHRFLHLAQAKVYGWMLCHEKEFQDLNVALVYYHVSSKTEEVLSENYQATELEDYFSRLAQ